MEMFLKYWENKITHKQQLASFFYLVPSDCQRPLDGTRCKEIIVLPHSYDLILFLAHFFFKVTRNSQGESRTSYFILCFFLILYSLLMHLEVPAKSPEHAAFVVLNWIWVPKHRCLQRLWDTKQFFSCIHVWLCQACGGERKKKDDACLIVHLLKLASGFCAALEVCQIPECVCVCAIHFPSLFWPLSPRARPFWCGALAPLHEKEDILCLIAAAARVEMNIVCTTEPDLISGTTFDGTPGFGITQWYDALWYYRIVLLQLRIN